MWTNENRARYERSRYPSDLTDDEWKLIDLPPAKRGGDKRTVVMREMVNSLMYVLRRKRGPALTRQAGMRVKRSRARSGIFSSIH